MRNLKGCFKEMQDMHSQFSKLSPDSAWFGPVVPNPQHWSKAVALGPIIYKQRFRLIPHIYNVELEAKITVGSPEFLSQKLFL